MMFASFLGTLDAIAQLKDTATAGAIQKMNPHLTVGQVKRLLKQLESEGYIVSEIVKYGRTGKYIYHLSDLCLINIGMFNKSIVRAGYENVEAA